MKMMLNAMASAAITNACNPTCGNEIMRSLFEPIPKPKEKIRITMIASETVSSLGNFWFLSR